MVLRKVGKLAYELELINTWKTHPVVSVVHLEKVDSKGPFGRTPPRPPPVVEEQFPDETDRYEVEYILDKRVSRDKNPIVRYLVHWTGRPPEFDI